MEVNQKWIDEGGIFYPIDGRTVLHQTPGSGIFQVIKNSNPQDGRVGLKKISDSFEFDFKVYDLGANGIIKRVQKAWESDVFTEGKKNLGVIFNGIKGTGKTISAKILCNTLGIPVLIVQSFFEGLLSFIQSIEFECIIFLDEAEKTFKKGEEGDDILLRLIDGVYNKSRKLYLLTTNNLYLNDNLLGRPGRIRYIKEFKNLPPSAVSEYIDDNLSPKYSFQKASIMQKVDLLEISTIDILKALVDEVNIFGCLSDDDDSGSMNVPTAKYIFDILLFQDIEDSKRIPEIKAFIEKQMEGFNKGFETWIRSNRSDGKGDEYDTNEDILSDEFGYTSIAKITSQNSRLWEGSICSRGTIITEPDKDGFFMIRENYRDTDCICKVIRQRGNPSLYRGGLAF